MKKSILFLSCFFCITLVTAQITFQKTVGGTSDDIANGIQQTTDGGYIIVGTTNSIGAGDFDIYLLKTDSNGDTLWTKTYGFLFADKAASVQQTTDGGYIIAGYTNTYELGGDICIIKTNSVGNITWENIYHNSNGGSQVKCLRQTSDGGYIIVGNDPQPFSIGDVNVSVVKLDSVGTVLWSKDYGGGSNDFGNYIQETSDGGFIITGYTLSFGVGNEDVYLIKTDSIGNISWTRSFGSVSPDIGKCVQQTIDGGYIITGTTSNITSDSVNVLLLKTDANGNTLWVRSYGSTKYDDANFVRQLPDKSYVLVGSTTGFGTDSSDVYLIKTDSSGSVIFSKTFGGANSEYGNDLQTTADGGYVISGSTNGFGVSNNDLYIIKTDSNGNAGCNENNVLTNTNITFLTILPTATTTNAAYVISIMDTTMKITGSGGTASTLCFSSGINEVHINNETLSIYPNPATNQITIEFELTETKNIFFEIKNVLGQTITSISNTAFQKGINKIEIDVSDQPSGIYILQLLNNRKSVYAKFIKQ